MNGNPKVSVVIPNYNYGRYLEARIESVLAQTYQNFEIILLDDASTDNSGEVLEKYRYFDKVSVCEINDRNTGSPFLQWKKGIGMSRGEYVWIAESDDLVDKHFLEKTVDLLENYPSASFCFTGAVVIDKDGNPMRKEYDRWTWLQRKSRKGYAVFPGTRYIAGNLYWKNYVYNASGVVFRRDKVDLFEDSPVFAMRYAGDWLFWVQLAMKGDVIEVYQKLNRFRKHRDSVTVGGQQVGAPTLETMQILKEIERLVPLSRYDRLIRQGTCYKHILRAHMAPDIQETLMAQFRSFWGDGRKIYRLERMNKYLSIFFFCLNRRRMNRCRIGWWPF